MVRSTWRRWLIVFVGTVAGVACGGGGEEDAVGPARFVAVGPAGTITSSPDGLAWTRESSGVTDSLNSVAVGPEGFVAVGTGGVVLSSRDGHTWRRRSSGTSVDLSQVLHNGDKFVAVGGDWDSGAVTIKSEDGVAWDAVDSPESYMFHAIAHGPGTLIAAGYYRSDLQTPDLFTREVAGGSSVSGDAWVQRPGPDFYDSLWTGEEVLVVGGGGVSSSRDGVSWTETTLPDAEGGYGIAMGDDGFVVVGERGAIFRSADGSTWEDLVRPAGDAWLGGVAHGMGRFVAAGLDGADGVTFASEDGVAWERTSTSPGARLRAVAFGPTPASP